MALGKKDKKKKENKKNATPEKNQNEDQTVLEEEIRKNSEDMGTVATQSPQTEVPAAEPEDFSSAQSDQTEVLSSRQRESCIQHVPFIIIYNHILPSHVFKSCSNSEFSKRLYNNGMDLTKVTCIVDFLEPRSLLEKLTDVVVHQHLLTQGFSLEDERERLFKLVLWYLSSWHSKPKGVRKPYNPVLGEVYRCYYDLEDGTRTAFMAEQVEHHPPISAIYGENKGHQVTFEGWYYPKSTWYGNSAGVVPKGTLKMRLHKFGETVTMTWPAIYARGLVFGKAMYEIAGKISMIITKDEKSKELPVDETKSPISGEESSTAETENENEEDEDTNSEEKASKLSAHIEFKSKPWFGGEYNNVSAHLKADGKIFKNLHGKWTDKIFVKNDKDKRSKGELVLDCSTEKSCPRKNLPESMNLPYESQVIWKDLTNNLKKNDLDAASKAKHIVEEQKRKEEKERIESGIEYKPRFFKKVDKDFYEFIGQDAPEFTSLLTNQ